MSALDDFIDMKPQYAPPYDSGIKNPNIRNWTGCKDGHHLHTMYDADGLSTIRLHDFGSSQVCGLVHTCGACGEELMHTTMVNADLLLEGQYEVIQLDRAYQKYGSRDTEHESDSAKAFRKARDEYVVSRLKAELHKERVNDYIKEVSQ